MSLSNREMARRRVVVWEQTVTRFFCAQPAKGDMLP